jgi:hypothetical protein
MSINHSNATYRIGIMVSDMEKSKASETAKKNTTIIGSTHGANQSAVIRYKSLKFSFANNTVTRTWKIKLYTGYRPAFITTNDIKGYGQTLPRSQWFQRKRSYKADPVPFASRSLNA